MKTPLTAERVRELLDYDPNTGIFKWRRLTRYHTRGDKTGTRDKDGRLRINVDRHRCISNRLAWLYMTGEWPTGFVDHRDNDPTNDRWDNLRLASAIENGRNRGKTKRNKTGFKGVSIHRRTGKFVAHINLGRRDKNLGYFDSAEEAHAAYCRAAAEIHGEFARTE